MLLPLNLLFDPLLLTALGPSSAIQPGACRFLGSAWRKLPLAASAVDLPSLQEHIAVSRRRLSSLAIQQECLRACLSCTQQTVAGSPASTRLFSACKSAKATAVTFEHLIELCTYALVLDAQHTAAVATAAHPDTILMQALSQLTLFRSVLTTKASGVHGV